MATIDYTKFSASGDSKKSEESNLDKRWWLENIKDRAPAVTAVVRSLVKYDSIRLMQYQTSARMYGNVSLMALNGVSHSRASAGSPFRKDRLTYNVIQSAVDTLVSKEAKNKPRPLFLTSGGDYKKQRKAKKLDKFVEGIFYENDAYHLGNAVRRDAFVLGDGLVQVFPHHGRVKFERVMADEIFVDWMEALTGNIRQLHRVKNMDRAVLIDLVPEKKAAIVRADSALEGIPGVSPNVSDQVTVIESWHLPSGPEAKDGLHTINLTDENLLDEDWAEHQFPFARRRWNPRQRGYWCQGIPEQVESLQVALNKMLWVEDRSFHLAGSFKVLLAVGSKVVKEHINNDIGTIVNYVGTEPKYVVPPVLPPGFEERKKFLIDSVFQQIGISQLSANSQKPAGLNSGKALREFNDIESDRFLADGQEDEKFYLDLARLTVTCATQLYKKEGSYSVKVPGRKFIQSIDWKDIDLEEDEFDLKIFPVSSLPNDPAGRLQTIQEYIQSGFIDPITGKRLLDFPDLEQHESLANAQEDWINMVLEKIVDDGEYTPPDPNMKLDLAMWFTLMYYAQGQTNNLDEERLEMLRTFKRQIEALQTTAQPPVPAGMPAAPGGGTPQASPMAPPQSDLIPNVPQPMGAMA